MCDTNTYDDDDECVMDLSVIKPKVSKFKPHSFEILGPPKSPTAAQAVPTLGTSLNGVKPEKLDVRVPKPSVIALAPRRREYVAPPVTEHGNRASDKTQVSDKTRVRSVSQDGNKQARRTSSRQSSTSTLTSIPETSRSEQSISEAAQYVRSTQRASAAEASISAAPTSKAPTSAASTSKSSKSKASEAPTSKPPTAKVPTPKPLTSKASIANTSDASKSKAPTSKSSTSKAPKSVASTANAPKASTSRDWTPEPSTSRASTSRASMSGASTLEASTSKKSSRASSTAQSKGKAKAGPAKDSTEQPRDFWLSTIKSKFMCKDYNEYLQNSGFTAAQAELLQNQFHKSAQEWRNSQNNRDRVTRTHKCETCGFTVHHQCVSFHFLHVGMGLDDTEQTIEPNETLICLCKFALFHGHAKDSSHDQVVVDPKSLGPDGKPLGKHFAIGVHCSVCNIILIIQHPPGRKNENKLDAWKTIENDDEKAFYEAIVSHFKDMPNIEPALSEMFRCTNGCCLIFHRCADP